MSDDSINNEQILSPLQKIRENKNIDEIAGLILNIISLTGLTVDEVASINYYIMKETLNAKHNKEFMKEKLSINVTQLGPEGIFQVQRALLSTYHEKIK
ncbi:hypothetical protein [Marinilactibacillus psychrotolerans]|uniref:Uncharacterized protein n=1 Tax=Marinilactibacillus psychrotolerans TaxID=191770 RepID=A0AAV3WWL0_9LACT|nr:hypothetical protein [Marinilactibacillus psychrotolerans]GEL67238.1 hypothetical protein MPS01_13930 [Marinilactibacillus psychrotolerans]GEQ36042.1 hypothetical protein M132T_15500 [Marinilactibacillus psychrotolerans]SDC61101.1 hypothetical protein SAMN04488013_10754 [Marinilactibacillus psychrotolerans]